MPKIVTVTLLRKGSTRLPGKNVRPLGGKPLHLWTQETALALGWPYHVYHNYEELVLLSGAQEHRYEGEGMRMDLLQELGADVYVMLPATSPFRDVDYIRRVVRQFVGQPRFKVMIPVADLRRGGVMFAFRAGQLQKSYFLDCAPGERFLLMDPVGIDIDTEEDWQEAETWVSRCTS